MSKNMSDRLQSSAKISRKKCPIFFVIFFLLNLILPVWADSLPDADEIMRHIDKLWRGDSSRALMSMTVKTEHYMRTMKMEAWSKGKEKSLIIIRAPRKDRGIATLKVKENVWNYLPKIQRVTKVPPSMMSGSWMGSHFTNDDLVKENTYEDDYHSQVSFKGLRDTVNVIEITSSPKENAAVVWGKIVTLIRAEDYIPMSSIYYDEEGKRIRTMTFDNISKIGNRTLPLRMTLIPEEKPEESTIVEYHELEFDVPIEDSMFSLKSLQRRR